MSFFKNIFGKKDNQNEEDSFADNELKREKNMNYKSVAKSTWEEVKRDTREAVENGKNKLKNYWDEIFK